MMTTNGNRRRIGEVAKEAGVNVQTLRYYERRGLLKKPERQPSGYRAYASEAVRLVRFIKRAQELGFTLAEIGELLWLREDHDATCSDVRGQAQAKIDEIDRKLRHLTGMRQALEVLVESCRGKGAVRKCPILESLDGGERGKE